MTVSAPPGATYAWSGPNGFNSTQPQISVDSVTLEMGGNYVVTITSPGICSSVLSRTISVKPLPVVNATATPNAICEGLSTLNLTRRAPYLNGPNTYLSNSKINSFNDATPAQSGVFSVRSQRGSIDMHAICIEWPETRKPSFWGWPVFSPPCNRL